MNNEVVAARKMLSGWPMVSTVLLIPMTYYGMFHLISEIQRLQADAPVIRVYAASILSPLVGMLVVAALASLIARAIPASPTVLHNMGRCINFLMLWGCAPPLLFVVFLARPLQQHYMPKLGYSECGLLHGNPTLWFTDWIKNPAWCVKGKDRDWVFEQAKLAEEKSAKPERAVMPAQTKQ